MGMITHLRAARLRREREARRVPEPLRGQLEALWNRVVERTVSTDAALALRDDPRFAFLLAINALRCRPDGPSLEAIERRLRVPFRELHEAVLSTDAEQISAYCVTLETWIRELRVQDLYQCALGYFYGPADLGMATRAVDTLLLAIEPDDAPLPEGISRIHCYTLAVRLLKDLDRVMTQRIVAAFTDFAGDVVELAPGIVVTRKEVISQGRLQFGQRSPEPEPSEVQDVSQHRSVSEASPPACSLVDLSRDAAPRPGPGALGEQATSARSHKATRAEVEWSDVEPQSTAVASIGVLSTVASGAEGATLRVNQLMPNQDGP